MQGYGSLCFGPINSRRFGLSLGLDLMGPEYEKQCNFDCLYCELPKGKKTVSPKNLPNVKELEEALKEGLEKNPNSEIVTLCANGEPTLHPSLKEIVLMTKHLANKRPLLILSNGSTICDEKVRDALKFCDIVKLSLDSAINESLKKVDRPLSDFDVEKVIDCMASFKKEFLGKLVVEILVVDGVNDSDEEIAPLKNALLKIAPDVIHLGTIARAPAYAVLPVSTEKLLKIQAGLLPLIAVLT